MKKIGWFFCVLLLFAACSKDYSYANQMLEFYDDVIDLYEDAEDMNELKVLRKQALQTRSKIEKEQKANHDELVYDIETYDENAYLVHLRLLTAESHAEWMYMKRKYELNQEEN